MCRWAILVARRSGADGASQIVTQTASGTSLSTHNGIPAVSDVFSYPLTINYDTTSEDGSSWYAKFDHSYNRVLEPSPFILSSTIKERQLADGSFVASSSGNHGSGTNNNTFSYLDAKVCTHAGYSYIVDLQLQGNTYYRSVGAVNNNITHDDISGTLATGAWGWFSFPTFPLAQKMLSADVRLPGGRTR